MKTYLGIDFGTVHVGLAIATSPFPEPLEVVSLEDSILRIASLVKEHHVQTIVIGISEGNMALQTRSFAALLKENVSVPIVFHDETLSSQRAQKAMQHKKKKDRRGADHHYAAALILQDYLDTLDTSV